VDDCLVFFFQGLYETGTDSGDSLSQGRGGREEKGAIVRKNFVEPGSYNLTERIRIVRECEVQGQHSAVTEDRKGKRGGADFFIDHAISSFSLINNNRHRSVLGD
jgi:hypothetical protein